ncbi:MAG: hypothetical protein V3R83_09765 [Gammaproteobacteria bacterium]
MRGIPTDLIEGTAWVIGGGPSLDGFDPTVLSGRTVVVTNEAFLESPDAVALVFADLGWWETRREVVLKSFNGIIITRGPHETVYRRDGIHWMQFHGRLDWSRDPTMMGAHNAGLIALNSAWLMGASAAVLLGFDMHTEAGRNNYHDRHPDKKGAEMDERYRQVFMPEFERAARRIEEDGFAVVNATPGSALRCFPKRSLEWCLDHMG